MATSETSSGEQTRDQRWWGTISRWAESRHEVALEQAKDGGGGSTLRLSPQVQRRKDLADSGLRGMLRTVVRELDRARPNAREVMPELRGAIYEWAKRRHRLALDPSSENLQRSREYDRTLAALLKAISALFDGNPEAFDRLAIEGLPDGQVVSKVFFIDSGLPGSDPERTNGAIHLFKAGDDNGIPSSIFYANRSTAQAVAAEHGLELQVR